MTSSGDCDLKLDYSIFSPGTFMLVKISYKRRARCVCSRLELQSEWSEPIHRAATCLYRLGNVAATFSYRDQEWSNSSLLNGAVGPGEGIALYILLMNVRSAQISRDLLLLSHVSDMPIYATQGRQQTFAPRRRRSSFCW